MFLGGLLPAGGGEDPEAVGDPWVAAHGVRGGTTHGRSASAASVTLGVGALSESETLLGTRGEGALALGGGGHRVSPAPRWRRISAPA